jgi:restriction endonuclease S subunit
LFDFARTTAGQYKVSLGRLRSAKIPISSLNEQCSIVTYLSSLQSEVDALKRHHGKTAAKLDALLPAVLERGFRGELG